MTDVGHHKQQVVLSLGVNQIGYDLIKFINDRVPGNVTTTKIHFFSRSKSANVADLTGLCGLIVTRKSLLGVQDLQV